MEVKAPAASGAGLQREGGTWQAHELLDGKAAVHDGDWSLDGQSLDWGLQRTKHSRLNMGTS